MYATYDDVQVREHECPRPLEAAVDEFDEGGMFFSPAGRWETITDRSPRSPYSPRVELHTDRTGTSYAWLFWRSTKFPYVPDWLVNQPRQVAVFDLDSAIEVEVTAERRFGGGHPRRRSQVADGIGQFASRLTSGGR